MTAEGKRVAAIQSGLEGIEHGFWQLRQPVPNVGSPISAMTQYARPRQALSGGGFEAASVSGFA